MNRQSRKDWYKLIKKMNSTNAVEYKASKVSNFSKCPPTCLSSFQSRQPSLGMRRSSLAIPYVLQINGCDNICVSKNLAVIGLGEVHFGQGIEDAEGNTSWLQEVPGIPLEGGSHADMHDE